MRTNVRAYTMKTIQSTNQLIRPKINHLKEHQHQDSSRHYPHYPHPKHHRGSVPA